MREILFRGKSSNDGNWVQGSLVVTTIEPDYGNPIKHYHIEDMTIGVFPNGFQSGISETVDPETVGQFTGLTDKNGKRIFEGDIIKRFWLGAEIIYCVQYDGGNTRFIGKAMNKRGFTTFDNDGEMFEIIGNIHDNP